MNEATLLVHTLHASHSPTVYVATLLAMRLRGMGLHVAPANGGGWLTIDLTFGGRS